MNVDIEPMWTLTPTPTSTSTSTPTLNISNNATVKRTIERILFLCFSTFTCIEKGFAAHAESYNYRSIRAWAFAFSSQALRTLFKWNRLACYIIKPNQVYLIFITEFVGYKGCHAVWITLKQYLYSVSFLN